VGWVSLPLAVVTRVSGYTCGNPEPCPGSYFRPVNPVTRGQTAKFISNAFFPGCQIPLRR